MKRNANIADFFKPSPRPKQSRLDAAGSTASSAPSPRVSHLPTPNPTPAGDTPPEPHLPGSDPAPASSPPSPPPSSGPTTRVASLPSSRLTSLNPPPHSHPPAQPRPGAKFPSPEMSRSSFSSLPPLSQTSNTSSRRVVKDGVQMVRASDSEEDSDSSLEDLSVLLAANKRPAPVESSSPARSSLSPRHGRKREYNFRSHPKRQKQVEKILPAPTKYKLSLAALAKQAIKDRAAELKSRQAEDAADQLEEELLKDDADDKVTEDNLLEAVGDEDRAREAREALERTGAHETFRVWRFFGSCQSSRRSRSFPKASLPSQGWQMLLKDAATRENALQMGLVQAGVTRNALPDDVISWMLDEVCFGTKPELKPAYLRILGSSNPQIRILLNRDRIQQLFSRMGARIGDCGHHVSLPGIVPTEVAEDETRPAVPAGLKWLLQLLRQSASQLTAEALEYGLEILLRVNFDDCVLIDGELQTFCRDAVGTFLAMLRTSFHDIARRIYTSLHDDPVLQWHLIASLPAHTPLQCIFRRRLALCFLLQNSTSALTTPLTSRAYLESIFAAILRTNPHFRINATTDFANVAAVANILDVAFETGFSDFSFATQLASIPRKQAFRDAEANARRQEALRLEEEFNAGIDKLVRFLHMVNDQMKSGIKNMIQSEAKVALDRVEHRIEYGVRTQEVSKRDVFEEMGYGAQSTMERWVKTEKVGDEKSHDIEQGGKKVNFADGEATPDGNVRAARRHALPEKRHEDEEKKKPIQNGTAPER